MRAKCCAQCGQPQVFVRRCLFCGSAETDFWEGAETQEITELLRDGRFEEALNLADQQVQRYPDEAEGYFLRLLARQKCVATEELLWKGFLPDEGTDLHSALLLSAGETREAIVEIETWMRNISRALLSAEDNYLATFRDHLRLLEKEQHLLKLGEKERAELYNLYRQIEDAEGEIHRAEEKCRASLSHAAQRLAEVRKKAGSAYTSTQEITEMSKQQYDYWKSQIADIEKATTEAVEEYNAAKVRYAQEISAPSRKREELSKSIARRLKEWNDKSSSVRDMLRKLEQEVVQVNARKKEIQMGLFSGAAGHLGETAFLHALEETGLKSLPESSTVLQKSNVSLKS